MTEIENTAIAKLHKNTISQYGLQIAKYIFPFITIPYLTRVLGPDVYAVRAYLIAVMGFVMVLLDYGFTTYGTKAIAQSRSNDERNLVTSSIMILRIVLCIVGIPLMILLCSFIPIMTNNPIYVAIAYISVVLKALLPDFVFQGKEDMSIITHRFVLTQAVSIILIFLLVHTPEDLIVVPSLEALSAFIALIWSWKNAFSQQGISFKRPNKEKIIDSFFQSTMFFISSAATTLITILSTVLIGVFLDDAAEISYWSLAMTAMTAVQSLYTPAVMALYPYMCSKRDFILFNKLLKIGIPSVLVGSILFAFLQDPVMFLLGGDEYMDGSYILGWISPIFIFSFISQMCGYPILAAVNKVDKLTTSTVCAALFNIVALSILVSSGNFNLCSLCIVRIITEAILAILRSVFVFIIRKHKQIN